MKLITAIILSVTAITAQAGDYETRFNECLNSQGSMFAGMRQGYCEKNVAKDKVVVSSNQTGNEYLVMLRADAEKQLAMAKAKGMICALRENNKGETFVLCKDEVGTFQLK